MGEVFLQNKISTKRENLFSFEHIYFPKIQYIFRAVMTNLVLYLVHLVECEFEVFLFTK